MPKLDLEPAKDVEFLDGFVNFLETKRNKCLTQEERDRYTKLAYHAKIEALAGRYIRNAGLHVKLEKLRSLPTGEKE